MVAPCPSRPANDPGSPPCAAALVAELMELGMDLARTIHARAEQAAGPGELAEVAAAFERVARCVRRTVLLARRLEEEPSPSRTRTAARRQLIRAVEDQIIRRARPDMVEAATAEFMERLDTPDVEDDIGTRPVEEIVADICRDLGLSAPNADGPWYRRRTPPDVVALCERAARTVHTAWGEPVGAGLSHARGLPSRPLAGEATESLTGSDGIPAKRAGGGHRSALSVRPAPAPSATPPPLP